jgi:hypothetical protein
MKHKSIKRLASAVAVAVMTVGAVALPASSAQADTGWPMVSTTKIHGNQK